MALRSMLGPKRVESVGEWGTYKFSSYRSLIGLATSRWIRWAEHVELMRNACRFQCDSEKRRDYYEGLVVKAI